MKNFSATNASNSANKDYYHTLAEGIVLCSAFVVEAVLIAFGNLLTVVLFAFNRKLCRKSLFLIINMAFSGPLLGAVCLPLYVYLIVGPAFQLWENAASYPDVSLLMKMCVQRKAALYPSHCPLRFITSHSRFALAMRKTKRLRRRLGKMHMSCRWG